VSASKSQQIISVFKALFTVRTFKSFCIRVSTLVSQQVGWINEALSTHGAGERPLPSVRRWWTVNSDDFLKPVPQWQHLNGLWSVWTRWWDIRSPEPL